MHSSEVNKFALETKQTLKSLNFRLKQGIVRNVIDEIVGSVEELKVYNYITVNSHVGYKSINWNRGPPKRREIDAF
jgi:hypothetical protein